MDSNLNLTSRVEEISSLTVDPNAEIKTVALSSRNMEPNSSGIIPLSNQSVMQLKAHTDDIETFSLDTNQGSETLTSSPVETASPSALDSFTFPAQAQKDEVVEQESPVEEKPVALDLQIPSASNETPVAVEPTQAAESLFSGIDSALQSGTETVVPETATATSEAPVEPTQEAENLFSGIDSALQSGTETVVPETANVTSETPVAVEPTQAADSSLSSIASASQDIDESKKEDIKEPDLFGLVNPGLVGTLMDDPGKQEEQPASEPEKKEYPSPEAQVIDIEEVKKLIEKATQESNEYIDEKAEIILEALKEIKQLFNEMKDSISKETAPVESVSDAEKLDLPSESVPVSDSLQGAPELPIQGFDSGVAPELGTMQVPTPEQPDVANQPLDESRVEGKFITF